MKIYIDSADIEQIREAISWGIVDGITTNPSLIKKAAERYLGEGGPDGLRDYIGKILEAAGDRPVSLEVIGPSEEEMVAQGLHLYESFNPTYGNVVVKIPVNPALSLGDRQAYDGLKAIKVIADRGIPVNTTLVFTPEQALLAAKAGAAYVSPFAGRIDDLIRTEDGGAFDKTAYFPAEGLRGSAAEAVRVEDNGVHSGVHLVEQIVDLFMAQGLDCQVLAASLRNPRQVRECAIVGAEIATIPFPVIQEMVDHKKTVEGMKAFLDDVVPEYRAMFPSGD